MAKAKAKTKRPPRTRRPKRGFLPGMEPISNPAIDAATDHYFDVMTERCKLSKQEHEAKDGLIDAMNTAGLHQYETPDGLVVTLLNQSNVKCKKKKDTAAESNGDSELLVDDD